MDYGITNDTIIEPDLLVVCSKINDKFPDFLPSLVEEVLSPSTAIKDRHTRFELLEKQITKYYLIVSADTEEVEVYELVNSVYELKNKDRNFNHTFNFGDDCIA